MSSFKERFKGVNQFHGGIEPFFVISREHYTRKEASKKINKFFTKDEQVNPDDLDKLNVIYGFTPRDLRIRGCPDRCWWTKPYLNEDNPSTKPIWGYEGK